MAEGQTPVERTVRGSTVAGMVETRYHPQARDTHPGFIADVLAGWCTPGSSKRRSVLNRRLERNGGGSPSGDLWWRVWADWLTPLVQQPIRPTTRVNWRHPRRVA